MISGFVLDASIALTWCFADEATPHTISILDRLEKEAAFVPELWVLEVGNILVLAERHKRITFSKASEFLNMMDNLNIQVDRETANHGFHEIFSIAYCEKITTYDAAYLELAMRLGIPLASKDAQLKNVAKKLGIKLL